jgi:hypothetical protein
MKYLPAFIALVVITISGLFISLVQYGVKPIVGADCGEVAITINKFSYLMSLFGNGTSDGQAFISSPTAEIASYYDIQIIREGNAAVILLNYRGNEEGRYVVAHKSLTWKGTQYECS